MPKKPVPRNTSFSYAFLILPASQRHAIVALWDFCRAVDDTVDEAMPGGSGPLTPDVRARAAAELQDWRAEIARCFEGGTPATPQGRRLAPFVAQFALPRAPFEDLVDGVEMDLDRHRYETFAELSEYCRRVASAVGLICIEIFGCRTRAAREYAVNLGLALQLTNIVRDVGSDLARGRVYLPQEEMSRYGVSDRDLAAGRVTPAVSGLLAFQCARAREYFSRAWRGLPRDETSRLTAAEIMGAIYFAILQEIERRGYDVFSSRVRVSRARRAWIALRTWARTLVPWRRAH
ncbi:MAG: presqualene diphosphate synthase HpnD [Vicinamibacterales bacterium]